MIYTVSYIVFAVFTVAILLGKFGGPPKPFPPAYRVLTISQMTFNADPDFFKRQAVLAGCTLRVDRDTGGWTEEYADGGYAHVCTRKDLAGQR